MERPSPAGFMDCVDDIPQLSIRRANPFLFFIIIIVVVYFLLPAIKSLLLTKTQLIYIFGSYEKSK